MNSINGAFTALFDLLLTPLEKVGSEFTLIVVSGVFGILALIVFKHISSQKGIKAAKDKIKGHMIEIRLYQNDLGLVSKAIGKVLVRNLQYLGLNFGPFVPLAIPFAFVVAQMVVRYSFDPVEVQRTAGLAGTGVTVMIELDDAHAGDAQDLRLLLPDGVQPASPLVRVPARGHAFQELRATRAGAFDLTIQLGDHSEVKTLHAMDDSEQSSRPRRMQPERTGSALMAILWPAEDTLPSSSGIARVSFVYPERDLGWLPGSGPLGVIIWFVVASMAFGFAALKPLGVQI